MLFWRVADLNEIRPPEKIAANQKTEKRRSNTYLENVISQSLGWSCTPTGGRGPLTVLDFGKGGYIAVCQ